VQVRKFEFRKYLSPEGHGRVDRRQLDRRHDVAKLRPNRRKLDGHQDEGRPCQTRPRRPHF
jgi:hypothetical protein